MSTITDERQLTTKNNGLDFPDWYVSLSFGKSHSKHYPQAVALAKEAPVYLENEAEGQIIHQAVYSHKPEEYLAFIKLYELISNWKSCFVIINGEHVDRKVIQGINYCYGDKCRSSNPDFCYGASMFTENPFGCHRLQVSAYNTPWWSFGQFDRSGIFHIDKESIRNRIIKYSGPHRQCPAFSWDKVEHGLKSLPDIINPEGDTRWVKRGEKIQPNRGGLDRDGSESVFTINIKFNSGEEPNKKPEGKKDVNTQKEEAQSGSSGFGCLAIIAIGIIVVIYTFFSEGCL